MLLFQQNYKSAHPLPVRTTNFPLWICQHVFNSWQWETVNYVANFSIILVEAKYGFCLAIKHLIFCAFPPVNDIQTSFPWVDWWGTVLHNKVTVITSSPVNIPEHNNLTLSSSLPPFTRGWNIPLLQLPLLMLNVFLVLFCLNTRVGRIFGFFAACSIQRECSKDEAKHCVGMWVDRTPHIMTSGGGAASLPRPFIIRCSASTDNFGSLLFFGKRQFFCPVFFFFHLCTMMVMLRYCP